VDLIAAGPAAPANVYPSRMGFALGEVPEARIATENPSVAATTPVPATRPVF
jgi:hypothetical protein